MENFQLLPLSSGGYAIVDDSDYEKVKLMKWHWCHRGVGSWDKKQLILLHNMIAPYEKVSFKNENKADCRRENLTKVKPGRKPGLKTNIYDDKSSSRFSIHRKIHENGQKYIWYTSVCYGDKKTMAEAFDKAIQVRDELFGLTREEFLEFVKNRPTRKIKYSEIISDWQQFDGKILSNAEMYQMNISHAYDPINS